MRLNKEKLSTKNSHKDSYSIKKHCFDKINTSIPEELESFSNVEETKKRKIQIRMMIIILIILRIYMKMKLI